MGQAEHRADQCQQDCTGNGIIGCGAQIRCDIMQQLKSHMKTLDEIREEVQESDRKEFDKKVASIRKKVYDAIESFGMMPGVDYEEGL